MIATHFGAIYLILADIIQLIYHTRNSTNQDKYAHHVDTGKPLRLKKHYTTNIN